jgi:hypothetical protein
MTITVKERQAFLNNPTGNHSKLDNHMTAQTYLVSHQPVGNFTYLLFVRDHGCTWLVAECSDNRSEKKDQWLIVMKSNCPSKVKSIKIRERKPKKNMIMEAVKRLLVCEINDC